MKRIMATALGLFCVLLGFASLPLPRTLRGGDGSDTLRYLFVGHGYLGGGPGHGVDPRLVGLNWSKFDKKIFGGDLNSEALRYESYVQFIDSAFDLGTRNTMYVIGNHDARNENFEWYEKYTHRKTYSAYSENGVTFMVMNTTLNAGNCEDLDAQFNMLKNICDTITSASSHLFIFSHHNLWINVPGLPPPFQYSNWQIPFWDAHCGDDSATYIAAIYPMLKEVKNKGVEVVSIMGDAGVAAKGLMMMSTDSLVYISNGIANSKYFNDSVLLAQQPLDKVLIISHVPSQKKAWWEYHDLDSLYQTQ